MAHPLEQLLMFIKCYAGKLQSETLLAAKFFGVTEMVDYSTVQLLTTVSSLCAVMKGDCTLLFSFVFQVDN